MVEELPVGGGSGNNPFGEEQPVGGGNGNNAFDEMPVGGGSNNNAFDEQPVGGGSGVAASESNAMEDDDAPVAAAESEDDAPVAAAEREDDAPVAAAESEDDAPVAAAESEDDALVAAAESNPIDEMPVGGGKGNNVFDDMPVGGGKGGSAFDDMPVGGGKGGSAFDDMPVGGGSGGNNPMDEMPVGGGGGKKNPFGGSEPMDEMPVGGAAAESSNPMDEMPVGGGQNNPQDEKPVAAAESNPMDEMPVGGSTEGNNPMDEMPVGGGGGKKNPFGGTDPMDEMPVGGGGGKKNPFGGTDPMDEMPVGGGGGKKNPFGGTDPMDEMPVGGGGGKKNPFGGSDPMDEMPVGGGGGKKNPFGGSDPMDEMPVGGGGGKKNPFGGSEPMDEMPVGGGGGKKNPFGGNEPLDELPVGGGGGKNPFGPGSMPDEFPPGGAAAAAGADDNKPLEERLVSKTSWQTRKAAFEELEGILKSYKTRTKNDVMNSHAPKWCKYLMDGNPASLEKVLDCFAVYIDKCDPAILTGFHNSIILPIIEKGMGAAKANIKTKALECMLLFFEVSENFGEETIEALDAQVKSKKPKIASTAMQLLAALMMGFGIKRFSPAKFGKQIDAAVNASAPALRAEGLNCYKAMLLYLGEAVVDPMLEKMKEAQKVQLKKDFEAMKAENKEFKRRTRTEQAAVASGAVEESKEEEKVDVFDLSAPKDILGQFGASWATETLAFKKWGDKKAAIDKVIEEADTPKLAQGNYQGLFDVLKKLAADPHATVAQYAIRAIGLLAKGLRKDFHDHGIAAIPVIFAKFKEKRLSEEIQTSLESIMMGIELGEILETLGAVKAEKLTYVQASIMVFTERAIKITYIDHLEEIADTIAGIAVGLSENKDNALRDQALVVLGVLLARVPDKVQSFVDPLIGAKKSKIEATKDAYEKTKYDESAKKAAAAKKKQAAAAAKPKAAAAKPKAQVMTFDDAPMVDAAADDNVLLEVAPPKPLGRKPPNIGKKPPSKKAAAPDPEEEKTAEPEPPKRGPPARLANRGAAAASSGPAKTVKASDIQEEDLGPGMSKETALEKVGAFYEASYVAAFEEAKWQDKQAGYTGIKEQIEQLKPDKVMVEATARFIKAKMKDWKESNLVMMKEAIQVLLLMTQHCEDVPKKAIFVYMPFLCDKIGDIKLNGPIKEALLNASEFCTAKFVTVSVVKKGLDAKAPNNLKESCNFLRQVIEEFGAGRVAIKEVIDFAVHASNHANKQVRDAAMALFAEIYKHIGEKTNSFLDGVKPATMQLIAAEFDKVTPYGRGEFQCTRSVKGEAAEEAQATGGGGGGGEPDALAALESALPRADISKQLNAKLMKLFDEADWKQKVKGCEQVNTILREAQMRIQPDGIGELMDKLKNNYKASNKAVLKQVIMLTGTMAEVVGQPILSYNKKNLKPLLAFLGDKAALMRADVVTSVNKWKEAIGAEHVINNMCTYLPDGNPELRNDSLKWIVENKAAIAKCEHREMVKPLIICLTDRSGPIRTMADEAIVETITHVGFAPFQEGIRDLKPAVQGTVKPLLDKAKAKAIAANPNAVNQEVEEEAPAAPTAATKTTASRAKPGAGRGAASKTTGAARPGTAAPAKSGPTLKVQTEERKQARGPSPRASPAKAVASTRAGARPAPKAAAPFQEEADDAFEINPGNKERRAAADNKSKWIHDEVKPQHLNIVKRQSEEIFGAEVSTLMWGADFKKHVKVIEKMLGLIETQPDDLKECVDIIFKWTNVKLNESNNTAFQSSVYDFYSKLFMFLIEGQYLFWEHEAEVVIPLLCDKVGNNNAILKQKVKALIKQCFEMHDQKKTLLMLIKFGAQNKNLKTAAEALDEIAYILRQMQSVPFGEQQIKIIAKLVDSKDAGVRENALAVLTEIYKVLDDDIWRVVGQVPLKVKGLLEQRFKKVKGLGASIPKNTPQSKPSPRRGGIGGGAAAASSAPAQQELTRSFNPGLKQPNKTPSKNNLRFSQQQPQETPTESSQKAGLTRSFRPGTASQSNLTRSFNQREGVKAFTAQRPGTAVNQQADVNRNTLQPRARQEDLVIPDVQAEQDLLRNTEAAINFHPEQQNNEMHFMDDDEDLRQQIEEMGDPKKEPLDPETQRQVDNIVKYISNLKYSSDLNKRVESLIALNDIIAAIQSYEKAIQHTANDLISALSHVLVDIFERPRQDTPLRFAKYFVTIVNKTCQCSIIMSVVREQELYELVEQLLTRLLIDNLNKLGDENEGQFIVNNLNGSMLRCLENCNKTSIFCVLFNLLRRHKDNAVQHKLPGLIIKCLLKLSKILEKLINELEIERVLLCIHLYLISINHEAKTSNDEMGIRIVKTLVHEMVKVKRHSILDQYKVVERHEVEDKHLHRWIKIILNTLEPEASSKASESSAAGSKGGGEIAQIIAELKSTDLFQAAIPKLHNYLARNPHPGLDYHIRDLSQNFQDMIRTHLEGYRNQLSDSGSTPNGANLNGAQNNPQDRPSLTSNSLSNSQSSKRFVPGQSRFGAGAVHTQSASDFAQIGQSSASSNPGGTSSHSRIGGGAGARQQAAGGAETSSDRMNQYQSKLSSMREKFQQRKQLGGPSAADLSKTQAAGSGSGQNTGTSASGKQNLSTSFSAMNSSLQQRWRQAQATKPTGTARESMGAPSGGSQLSNTMAPPGGRFQTEKVPNQGLTASNNAEPSAAGQAGASNQDLNKRLLELKGKLAALKKN